MKLRPLIFVVLLLFPACGGEKQSTNVEIALTDGTHVGGELVAVDDDWLVLDQSPRSEDVPLALLDYSLIDTVRIINNASWFTKTVAAEIGGGIGAIAGIFIASGWTFDSTKFAAVSSTRQWLGVGAGALVGAVLGYWVGAAIKEPDRIFPQPSPEDYAYIREYALYPDSLPPALRLAIDSSGAGEAK